MDIVEADVENRGIRLQSAINPISGFCKPDHSALWIEDHCWEQPSKQCSSISNHLGAEQLKILAQRLYVVKGLKLTRLHVIKPHIHSRVPRLQAIRILCLPLLEQLKPLALPRK